MKLKNIIQYIGVFSLLTFLFANMYPNFLPILGKVLANQLINPTFWLTIIVIAQFAYILKLKNRI